jgi:competence protein ComEA
VEQLQLFLKQYGVVVGVGVLGLVLLLYGLWGQILPQESTVEIIKGPEKSIDTSLVIDVSGAVLNPGVYTLPSKSRIGDAIVLAGGFAAEADRSWVAQTLNLASELKDAQKIYIPSLGEHGADSGTLVNTRSQGRININTASIAELDALPGIGRVRAQAIIDNRPYSDVSELVSKAKVPQTVFESIQDQLSVY